MRKFSSFPVFVLTVAFLGMLTICRVYAETISQKQNNSTNSAAGYHLYSQHDIKKFKSLSVDGTPRNIIMIIGNGLGQGAIKYTALRTMNKNSGLLMESLPVSALVSTTGQDNEKPDSAAAGTALACGYKTSNGKIGLAHGNHNLPNIAELAKASGRSVGILTTNSLTGATAAAFTSHVTSKSMMEKIA